MNLNKWFFLRNMQSKGYIQTGSSSESGGVRAMMNSLMQLRKICNHPFLFHQVEEEYYNHVNSGRFVSGYVHDKLKTMMTFNSIKFLLSHIETPTWYLF